MIVFTANPQDYTNRGAIITPLKDRIDSQILTHYPRSVEIARRITAQEAWTERGGIDATIEIPDYVRDVVEEVAFEARGSELVDQSSGVSARMPISAIEVLVSNLERRAALTGESHLFPRLSDLMMILPAVTGKVEMVYEGEQQGTEVVGRKLISAALMKLFSRRFPPIERAGTEERARRSAFDEDEEDVDLGPFAQRRPRPGAGRGAPEPEPEEESAAKETAWDGIVEWFSEGQKITLSDEQTFEQYFGELSRVPHLAETARKYFEPSHDQELAFAMELILEALHQAVRLSREDLDSTVSFSELMKFNVLRTVT